MLKLLADAVFSFDVEWIPDPKSAEILHETGPADGPGDDARVSFEALWASARKEGQAEDFQPYLKTILCRIVSLAGILREKVPGGDCSLKLVSLPVDPTDPAKCGEKALLANFLKSVGRKKPQLVGYNSAQADVPIIVQRSIVNGLPGFGFSDRPDKPWLGVDYFDARNSIITPIWPMPWGSTGSAFFASGGDSERYSRQNRRERKFGCGNVAPGQAFGNRGLQ